MTRADAVARIRHDLGKYVALQQRWLPPGATADERRAAVLADVLETRRSPRSTDDAVAVWAGLAEERAVLGDEVREIDALVGELARTMEALRRGEGVEEAGRVALAISEACRQLK